MTPEPTNNAKITLRALFLGTVIAGLFAYITVYFENRVNIILTATQIAVMPYMLLFLTVLLVNPVGRIMTAILGGVDGPLKFVARIFRQFTMAETLIIFIMGSVSAGLSTFGLASQLMPLAGSYFNQHWNDRQAKWDEYVTPYISESFFVSEPGIREAATEYRAAVLDLERYRRPYELALRIEATREKMEEAKVALATLEAANADVVEGEESDALLTARKMAKTANTAYEQAQEEYAAMQAEYGMPEMASVLDTYPDEIAKREVTRDAAMAALDALQEVAFAHVQTFRRGLPTEMRSFPGAIMVKGEDFSMYMGRVRRFLNGISARGGVESALAAVKAGKPLPADQLQTAIDALTPVSDSTELEAEKAALNAEWEAANTKFLANAESLKELRRQRDIAEPGEWAALDAKIADLSTASEGLSESKADLTIRKQRVETQIESTGRVQTAIATLTRLKTEAPSGEAAATELEALLVTFPAFDASWRRFLIGEVPYGVWLRPLFAWGLLIGLTYVVLMAFNVLIFRQWAHNERLIYPLAELPELLVGFSSGGEHEEDPKAWIPSLYKSGLFWIGFSISAGFLGYMLLRSTNVIPNLPDIVKLKLNWKEYIAKDSLFAAVLPSANSQIFFTMIGLSFLIPSKISFSMWFFYLLYMLQLIVMVSLGHGTNESSFPGDWSYTFNFRFAEGGGALVVFASFILWKCRKYLFSLFMPKALEDLEPPERKELRIASACFIFGSIGVVLILWLGMGASLMWTIFSGFIILIITIGLVRAVTEGGILGFQAWVSPFHFIRTLFGMDKAWTAPPLFLPLFIYYSIMFLDIKTFIAPTMANSIKVRDDLKMKRLHFHFAIALGICFAGFVAIVTHLMLAYNKGADQMHGWFYNSLPPYIFDKAADLSKYPQVDTEGTGWWLFAGSVIMAGLLYLRQTFFFLPHPIGLIMLVSPIMGSYWFSIMLGWLFKTLVTKYGNKSTYDRVRAAFIGLIMGELFIITLSTLISYYFQMRVGMSLNR